MLKNQKEAGLLRPISCEQGVLSQADGSAAFHQGGTSVLAAVYGPADVRSAREEHLDRAVIEVTYHSKSGQLGCEGRATEKLLRGISTNSVLAALHPQSRFTIAVQEIQDGGSLISCAINAVCAALLDVCAPMRWTVAAVSCAVLEDGSIVALAIESTATSAYVFVFDSVCCGVVASETVRKLRGGGDEFNRCMERCREASEIIFAKYREAYKDSMLQ